MGEIICKQCRGKDFNGVLGLRAHWRAEHPWEYARIAHSLRKLDEIIKQAEEVVAEQESA